MTQEQQSSSTIQENNDSATTTEDAENAAAPAVTDDAKTVKAAPVPLTTEEVHRLYEVLSRSISHEAFVGPGVPESFGSPEDLKGYRLSGGVWVLTFRTATHPAYDALPEDLRMHLLLRRVHFHPNEVRVKQGRDQVTHGYSAPNRGAASLASGWTASQWALAETIEEELSRVPDEDAQAELRRIVESPSFRDWQSMGIKFTLEAEQPISSVHKKYRMMKPPAWQVAIGEWKSGLESLRTARDEQKYARLLESLGLDAG